MSQYVIEGSKPLREDEIYQWFVDNAAAIKIDQNPLEFVEDLVARSNDYANFAEKKDTFGVPNHYLNNISLLSGAARQHFILLLAGHHLPQNLFNELCRTIENLFFTYIVTRETTKQFERNFSKWASELRDVTDKNGLSEFIARNFIPDLKSRSNAFNFAFEELTQSRIQQYRLRYILAKLTQFIEQQAWGNPEFANLDQYVNKSVEIEHILPQLPTTELQQSFDKSDEYDVYKEKLGNLTLLEKTINASISRNPFEKKKNGYLESKFLLTTSLVRKPQVGVNTQLNRAVDELIQFEEWNSETIELRQQMLADLARKVWEIPD
jgi:hypothetical protein